MREDMARFSVLAIVVVAFFLALLFRRVSGVILPIASVFVSVVSTLAFMGATRTPMMPPTQIIPSFLLAVGVGGAVHLLAIFYQARRRGATKADAAAATAATRQKRRPVASILEAPMCRPAPTQARVLRSSIKRALVRGLPGNYRS